MTIAVGDKLPAGTLATMGKDGPEAVTVEDYFRGKTVALFAVPGAFTPTCSIQHLPGFVDKANDLKARGIDEIACLAANDPFVMQAWAKSRNVGENVTMLSDSGAAFAAAMGLDLDLSGLGLGPRSRRFSMVVADGKVTHLFVEDNPGAHDVSSAEHMLASL